MSEKSRLIAECKRLNPGFRAVEHLVAQGTVFQVVLADGTTMHVQFPKGVYGREEQRNIKLRMLREALVAIRFAAPQPALESTDGALKAQLPQAPLSEATETFLEKHRNTVLR